MYKKKAPNTRLIYEKGKVLSQRAKLNLAKTRANFFLDPYFYLLDSGWRVYLALFFSAFLLMNTLFACFYFYGAAKISGMEQKNFIQCFFFSVQTFSTVGYGLMSPQNTIANILVSSQIMLGVLFTAGFTGLFFAKLSKPKVKVMFSKNVLIHKRNGKDVLTFRVANQRANAIVMAKMSVSVLVDEISEEGHHRRVIKDLRLQRNKTSLFALSWSLYHEIDDMSPLYKVRDSAVSNHLIALSTMLTGYDGTQSQTIYKNHVYYPEDIKLDAYFKDIIESNHLGELSVRYSDFDLIHEAENSKA